MTGIIEKIRNLTEDLLITTGKDNYTYESSLSSKVIPLTGSNVVESTIKVYKNGSLWADSNYSYDSDTGQLTVTGSLTIGDNLLITYSYYLKYSDTELKGYSKAAFSYISVEKYKTFVEKTNDIIFPTPSEEEENLIAIIASILIKGDIRSYRTPELNVTFNDSDSKEIKIRKVVRQFKKTYGYTNYIELDKTVVNEEDC